jgi:hypothetical protein
VVGTAPPPADDLVEVADKSVVPAEEPVVVAEELVGAEELAVDEISDEVASCPDAILGQTLIASPSTGMTKTLRAFKFSRMVSYDRAKKPEI